MKRSITSNRVNKLKNKSGKVECDLCHVTSVLVKHHINGRKVKNANLKWNTCNICGSCHLEVHNGIRVIEGWVTTSNGLVLFWHYKGGNNQTGQESNTYIIP